MTGVQTCALPISKGSKPSLKNSIILLGSGTFLEYFDFMLYVHMAVLLNELFFPQTDPFTTSLLSAFAFCKAIFAGFPVPKSLCV